MNHTRNHYAIGGLAVALALGGAAYVSHRVDSLPVARVQHFAWPGLNDGQEAALQARLEALGKHDVTIWCATANCSDIAEDLQYVAYMAGWDTHSAPPSMTKLPDGISIAAQDDATAKAFAAVFEPTIGLKIGVTRVDPRDAADLSIVIGSR